MLEIYKWLVLITGIFFTSFGLFVYFSGRQNKAQRRFGYFSAAFAIWCYSWFLTILYSNDDQLALFFAKSLNIGATLMPALYLNWILTVLNLDIKKQKLLNFFFIITTAFLTISFSDLYIPGIRKISIFPVWPIAGPLYTFFLLWVYAAAVTLSLYLLIKNIIVINHENCNLFFPMDWKNCLFKI